MYIVVEKFDHYVINDQEVAAVLVDFQSGTHIFFMLPTYLSWKCNLTQGVLNL